MNLLLTITKTVNQHIRWAMRILKSEFVLCSWFLFLAITLTGCVHNVPLSVDLYRDMNQALPNTKKIPIKVGIYFSDDLMTYIYKQQKMGMTFQMDVGKYLPPISMQMGIAMFEDIIPVKSLPPYWDGYKPDVEAVVKPEILYCYGNAVGILGGYIEARTRIRITAYDLSGKVLWQDEAEGASRSKNVDFVSTFLNGMEDVGKTGYRAAFAAAVRMINDFNAQPPKELYSLLEIKDIKKLRNRRNISNFEIFRNYYQKGQFQYEKRNYYQALYSFKKADYINPDDLSTLFYLGVCYTYTGSKDMAIGKFRRVIEIGPHSQEARDAKKWIDLLVEPLKIAIVNTYKVESYGLNFTSIDETLRDSRMYELLDVSDLKPPTTTDSKKEWHDFLERCYKRGAKVVIFNDISYVSQKMRPYQYSVGDFATEHILEIASKAHSSRKKTVEAEIRINERTITIKGKNENEEGAIKGLLLKKGTEKLVLRLLENDIF